MADKRKRTSSSKSKSGGIISGVVDQTTHIAGEMLDSAGNVANTARETGAEWVAGVSPTAAEMLRPGSKKKTAVGGRAARQPAKTAAKATTGAAQAARSTAKTAGKATKQATKTASKATKQVARNAQKVASGARKSAPAKSSKKK